MLRAGSIRRSTRGSGEVSVMQRVSFAHGAVSNQKIESMRPGRFEIVIPETVWRDDEKDLGEPPIGGRLYSLRSRSPRRGLRPPGDDPLATPRRAWCPNLFSPSLSLTFHCTPACLRLSAGISILASLTGGRKRPPPSILSQDRVGRTRPADPRVNEAPSIAKKYAPNSARSLAISA